MDKETIELAFQFADKITSFGLMLFFIGYLMKELSKAQTMLYSDWQQQRTRESLKDKE